MDQTLCMTYLVLTEDIVICAGPKVYSKFLRIVFFIHRFTEITYFTLRGICLELDKLVDLIFIVDLGAIERDPKIGIELIGASKAKIVLDKKINRWTIISLKDGSVILSLDSEVSMILWAAKLKLFKNLENTSLGTPEMEHSSEHMQR